MTTNGKKPERDPAEVLRAIEAIDRDPLNPDYPIELVDEELRAEGFDPEAIRRRGEALAAELLAKRRAALRDESVARMAPLAERVRAAKGKRPTAEIMRERIARAEADPRFTGRIAVAARGRRPDEPTEEELGALYDTLVALGIVTDESEGEGNG